MPFWQVVAGVLDGVMHVLPSALQTWVGSAQSAEVEQCVLQAVRAAQARPPAQAWLAPVYPHTPASEHCAVDVSMPFAHPAA